ncbi:M16 family metallopeptidase [Oceanibacterium hippocampi]|uniref:Protease 3 n=1 Tax=Oceanibacterium hippocampi TaxID=745714 RepID=A0A1Y5S6F0_9PROT|nr:pitrilysin family protein [Oceanibacterium hippocampi]SLN33324.1 Protease 3 precursor [Oceanibacterium hippocampi]
MSNEEHLRVTTLDNGVRVISETMPHLRSATVGVWVDAGSRHETPELNGISHVLEHMAFKGTTRRSARQIAEEIEAVGGHLNAYTSREQTAYYARVLEDDVPLGFDILSDILLNSTFDPAELAREQDVIVQEIAQTNDTPDDVIFDHLQAVAYPEQALGRSILGTEWHVRNFRSETVRDYMAAHYHAPRLVVAAAGAVDHEALVGLAGEAFTGLPTGAGPELEPARYGGGDYREDRRSLEQLHLALAFPGAAFEDPDFYDLQVLSALLGGGMSSRLFQELREQRGLCYSVFSFATGHADTGLFSIYAATDPEDIEELVPSMADEIAAVARSIDGAEVDRARAQIKAGLLMSLESPSGRCEQLARQLLIYGRPLSLDEVVSAVDQVTPEGIAAAASRVLFGNKPSIAALGPLDRLESFDRIASRFA